MSSQEDYLDSLLREMTEGIDKVNMQKEDADVKDKESVAEASKKVLSSDKLEENKDSGELLEASVTDIYSNEVPGGAEIIKSDTDIEELSESTESAKVMENNFGLSETDMDLGDFTTNVKHLDIDEGLDEISKISETDKDMEENPELSGMFAEDKEKMPGTSLEAFSDMSIEDLEALSRMIETEEETEEEETGEKETEAKETEEDVTGEEVTETKAPETDFYSEIGDDIEERIRMAAELPPVSEEFPDDDVLSMMAESDDGDLKEIQELLKKSENNEILDNSIDDIPKESWEENELMDLLSDKPEETKEDKRKKKREDKVKAKAEKKEAAEKRKAENAARKAAQKAVKQSAKQSKTKNGKTKKGNAKKEAAIISDDGLQSEDGQEFDISVLDSIVSEAARADSVSQDVGTAETFYEQFEEMPVTDDSDDESLTEMNKLFEVETVGEVEAEDIIPEKSKTDSQKKKKGGFLSRILEFITEEEEEEENENIRLSEENQNILNELDNEKGKKKKNRKNKKRNADAETDIPEKKPVKKKEARKKTKEKRERPRKEEPLLPDKKLTLKKMMPVFLVGVSVGILLFVFVSSTVDYTHKKAGRDAYYEGDYQTCYQNLFGKDLDETESIMFAKSKSILYIRLWLREYQMFAEEGDRVRGLDSLIQTVEDYPVLYEYAKQWNAGEEVAEGYAEILNVLQRDYGMTEKQALEIAGLRKDEDYTRAVVAAAGENISKGNSTGAPGIVNEENGTTESGEEYRKPDAGEGEKEKESEEKLPDLLPEEEELKAIEFYDNQ